MKSAGFVFAAASVFALFGNCAFAQVIGGAATPLNEIAPKWHLGYSFDAGFEGTPSVDTGDALDGEVSTYTASANLKFQGAYDMRHFVTVSLNYAYSHFDFDSGPSRMDSPFSSLNRTSALVFYTYKIDDKWGLFTLANFSFGADSGASLWGGRQFSGGLGATYAFRPGLTLGFGGMAYSRMDNDWLGFPVAFLDWRVNERLTIRTMAGVTAFYDVFADKSLILSATFEYRNGYYRMSDLPLAGGGSARRSVSDSYFNFNVGATYNWTKNLYTSLNVGANFNRTLQFRYANRSADEIDVDAAPVFMFHAGWLF